MTQKHLWQLLLILFVVTWSIFELIPPTNGDLMAEFQAQARSKDATFTNIIERAKLLATQNPNRSPYSNIKEAMGTNDITKYFNINAKGEKNPSAFVLNALQRDIAGKIKLGLDLQGGTAFTVAMDTSKLSTNTDHARAIVDAVDVLRKRVDRLGVAEPILQPTGPDRILIQLPGLSQAEMDEAREIIQKAAFLEFRMVHPESNELLNQELTEPGYEVLRVERTDKRTKEKQIIPYLVKIGAERGLTGRHIKHASVIRQQLTNEPEISFEMDEEGARLFAEITRQYQPKGGKKYQLAIVLDGELASAPSINDVIEHGRGVISGDFDVREAFTLQNVLENPLQAPVKIEQETRVEPSLGEATVRSGVTSAIVGTAAVAAFMLIYYMFAGFVANVALILNIIITMGVLCSVGTTLTMPGIAGIVLTVGMAVDANVLIFERIREELAAGKSMRGALATGYSKAFSTIFDSHFTTFLSAVILIYMGTGPVKGFGVTLAIGVALSLFTSLVVTRLIFDFLLSKNKLKGLKMLHLIRGTKFDFMKWAKPAFAASWLLIIVGVSYGIYRGNDVLGVEFAGGETMTLTFSKKAPVDDVKEVLKKLNLGEPMVSYEKEITGSKETLRVTTKLVEGTDEASGTKVVEALKKEFKDSNFQRVNSERIGASVGKDIQQTAVVASLLAMFGILVYVAFRYEFSFAVGAVVAILHDVLMTMGLFFLTGREMSAPMVAAILTIIGFSINDTIVIFDRIREDLKLGVRGTFRELMNHALNQTLSRTLITSGTVLLATLSLYLFGGGVINDFAFTFLVGILTGTYSSIYIASALVLWWHKGQRPNIGSGVTMEGAATARTPVSTGA